MKRRVGVGMAVALFYVVGAAITSHLTPFGSRPVLDGIRPPPAYRWVKPPADLASTNEKPFGGTFSLKFTGAQSQAGAFTTRDSQLSMVLDPGALAPEGNPTGARISITPMAPSSISQPSGYHVDGNVYRISIKEEPSGNAVTRFVHPQRILLVYPADKSFIKPQHLLATSSDGKSWTRVKTQDSTIQQQSSGLIRSPGLVAVISTVKSRPSSRAVLEYVLLGAAIVAIVAFLIWGIYGRSRTSRPGRR
ncbi:MAG TPA: hypothetical protein VHV50_01890 [Actinomycetota bacterium]|jgi:hypothetical protein|nr:hypothetical protein [Actinomycetota bacterium]